jgi:hypothetical protein
MRPVVLTAYVVMALWLFLVSVLRLALSAGSGTPVDGLPFVTGGLGLVALVILAPAAIRIVRGRRAHRDERSPQRGTGGGAQR